VKDFARGCMRTYLILKERAAQWNNDTEIQALLRESTAGTAPSVAKYSSSTRDAVLSASADRVALASKGLAYERLDQLTMEVLLGVR
jgi:xylose isomerase